MIVTHLTRFNYWLPTSLEKGRWKHFMMLNNFIGIPVSLLMTVDGITLGFIDVRDTTNSKTISCHLYEWRVTFLEKTRKVSSGKKKEGQKRGMK